MSEIVLDVQGQPAAPAAGQVIIYPDDITLQLQAKINNGAVETLGDLDNVSVANVAAAFAADTYLAGSAILLPRSQPRIGTTYRCRFDMVKTAAGVAAFAINVRFGVNQTTADAARLTFTFGAGTAAIDTGIFEVFVHFRSIGAAGVIAGMARCTHHLAATGLISTGASGTGIITNQVSAGFDTTVASSFIGISVNGGAAFSGTNSIVQARLYKI